MITLYSYFRSSTAYRVRIVLNLKGLDYQIVPVNIFTGEHHHDDYRAINPLMGVPALVHHDVAIGQSLAIIEYLDSITIDPPMVSGSAVEKAYIRQVSQIIASDIHPLTNLKVMNALRDDFAADETDRKAWYARWAIAGITGVETVLRQRGLAGDFVLGDRVSMADACLIPQMYSLRRYQIPLDDYPLCRRIEAHCMGLEAFQQASPEMQPDAPADLEQIHGLNFQTSWNVN